jgi:hypothetical protein
MADEHENKIPIYVNRKKYEAPEHEMTGREILALAGPQAADQFSIFAGINWQRWSWHYPGWNPATHNLTTHLEACRDRLFQGT